MPHLCIFIVLKRINDMLETLELILNSIMEKFTKKVLQLCVSRKLINSSLDKFYQKNIIGSLFLAGIIWKFPFESMKNLKQ